MASRLVTQRLGSLTPTLTPGASSIANNRSQTQMISAMRTMYIDIVIQATVTIGTANATAILNGGNLASLFSFIGINENGSDTCNLLATQWQYYSQAVGARVPQDVVLTNTAQGSYNLRSIIRMPFRWPWGKAAEVAYIEANPQQNTFVFVTPRSDLSTANNYLVTPGSSGTAAISNLTIDVIQTFDDLAVISAPYFVPQFRTISQPVSSNGSDVPLYVRSNQLIRSIAVQTNDGNLLVDDLISQFRLKDDMRTYIGDPKISPLHWQLMSGFGYAGDMVGDGSGFLYDWQQWGQLSKVYNPARAGTNLRFEIDQTVQSYTSGMIYVAVNELLRIPGRTREGLPAGLTGV